MPSHTPEEERLLVLIAELTSRPGYIHGDLPFPRPVSRADAIAIADDVQRAVDMGTSLRAEVVAKQGEIIACRAGCSACCEQLVMIWAGEAELIADWLRAPENADIRQKFVDAYASWRDALGDSIDRIIAFTDAGDTKEQFAALVAHWRRHVVCAFNRDGLCTIYPVRPVLCRSYHALDTSDNCRPADDTGSAATHMYFKPLEEFLDKTRSLAMAVHHAVGGPKGRPEPLCTAVHDRLAER
jgi:Fe-S-cluster containining protein